MGAGGGGWREKEGLRYELGREKGQGQWGKGTATLSARARTGDKISRAEVVCYGNLS